MKTDNIDFLKQVIASLSSNPVMLPLKITGFTDVHASSKANANTIILQAVKIVEAFEAKEITIRRGEDIEV